MEPGAARREYRRPLSGKNKRKNRAPQISGAPAMKSTSPKLVLCPAGCEAGLPTARLSLFSMSVLYSAGGKEIWETLSSPQLANPEVEDIADFRQVRKLL